MKQLSKKTSLRGSLKRANRAKTLLLEVMEDRIVLDNTVTINKDIVFDSTSDSSWNQKSILIGNLSEGDQIVLISANLSNQENGKPGTAYADISFSAGSTITLPRLWAKSRPSIPPQTIIVSANGNAFINYGVFWNSFGKVGDAYLTINYKVVKSPDVKVIGPTLGANGEVTYGYIRVDGDQPLSFGGAYVETALYYAVGPNKTDIRGKAIDSINIDSSREENVASTPYRKRNQTVYPSQFRAYPPPEGCTHLVVLYDLENKSNDGPKSNNIASYKLPNIVALAPIVLKDNPSTPEVDSVSIGCRIENGPLVFDQNRNITTNVLDVQAFWSKTEKWEDRTSEVPIFSTQLNPFGVGDQRFVIDGRKLAEPPEDARYLLTRVDRFNWALESNEKDNVHALALFDARVTSLQWDGKGGLNFTVNLKNLKNIPDRSNLRVEFYWSTDGTLDGIMPGNPVYKYLISRGSKTYYDGDNKYSVDAKYLPTPTPGQIFDFKETVYYLVTVVRNDGFPATASSHDGIKNIMLPLVSLELFDAPGAATDKERVSLWITKHSDKIKAAAKEFRIDPRAIAGVIAWEAYAAPGRTILGIEWLPPKRIVENYYYQNGVPLEQLSRAANSPGKVHCDTDSILAKLPGEPYPPIVEEVEKLGYLPAMSSSAARRQTLEDRKYGISNSIRYIGAIMGAYADAFEQIHPQQPIRNRPEILATLYNGVSTWPNLTSVFENLPNLGDNYKPEVGKAPYAGDWLNNKNNLNYIQKALGGRFMSIKTPGTYTPVKLEKDVPWGSDLRIPFTELLNTGGDQVVGFVPNEYGSGFRIDGNAVVITDLPNISEPVNYYFSVMFMGKVVYGGRLTVNITPPVPSAFKALVTGPESVTLSWQSLPAANSVVVEKLVNGVWQVLSTVSGPQSTWLGNGLKPSTEYEYRLRSTDKKGRTSSPTSSLHVQTTSGLSSDPTNLRVLNITARNITVKWNEVTGEDHYEVEVSNDTGRTWRLQENVPADHAYETVLTVTPGRSYQFRVFAVNRFGRSNPSNIIEVTANNDMIVSPGNLRADNIWSRAIDLLWDDRSSNENEFIISVSRDGINWFKMGSVSANNNKYRANGLEPSSRYWFKVQAGNASVLSDFSNIIDVTTKSESTNPAAPTDLIVSDIWSTIADIRWKDQSTNEAGFRILVSEDNKNFVESSIVLPNTTSQRIEGFQPERQYWVRVVAYGDPADAATNSLPSNTITFKTRLTPPTALSSSDMWDTAIDLVWNDNTNQESGYLIQKSTDGVLFTDAGSVASNITKARMTRLNAESNYWFRVRAYNNDGNSSPSNVLSVTTKLATPSGLILSDVWSTIADIRWADNSSKESGYKVELSEDNRTFTEISALPANSNYLRITGLQAEKNYWVRVYAYNDQNRSHVSDVVSFETMMTPPSNLGTSDVWSTALDLIWQDNTTQENGYLIQKSTDGVNFTDAGTVAANITKFRVTGLDAESNYWFRIRAYNNEGKSAPSDVFPIMTKLATPTNLIVSDVWSTIADIRWTDNSQKETGYNVELSEDNQTFNSIITLAANSTYLRISGLQSEKNYWVRIYAYNDQTTSHVSDVLPFKTMMTPPSNLATSDIWSTALDLVWQDNTSLENGYLIQKSTDGVNFTDVGTVAANTTKYRVQGLDAESNYWFRIRAYNNDGYSAPSGVLPVTTKLGTPTSLVASDIWSTIVDLTWLDNSNQETSYKIYYSTDNATFTELISVGADVTKVRIRGLRANTTYWFKVIATNATNTSHFSSTLQLKTKP